VNYANESSQAALERSRQDARDVISISKAAVWTVADVARSIDIFLKIIILFIYLFYTR